MEDISLLLALAIAGLAFAAAVVGGIAGLGTAIAMIPVLTFAFGVREAIPIIAIAVTLNNLSRAWANRKHIDYRVALWFSIGAVPTSVLGGVAFATAPAGLIVRALGTFLLLLVVYRHLPIGKGMERHNVRLFGFVGLVQGFLSSVFGGAGPFGAHFFLAYGLYRNAFVGTVALATTSINIVKSSTYAAFALIDGESLAIALGIGGIMVVGAYIGGMLVSHVPDRVFVYIVEAIMIVSGLVLLVRG
jgi:uncharacterized membrane protein YfcA